MKNFALAGNPNSGKTTLFNRLTKSTAKVGNWAGVTVEKKEGTYSGLNEKVHIIDLPGIYSLSPYTLEEVVTRDYLIDEKPDCIINIVDATNLERNLYLTTQLLEIGVPVVIALNMIDVARANNMDINIEKIKKAFNVPVVEISALRGEGIVELMEIAEAEGKKTRIANSVLINSDLSKLIVSAESLLANNACDNTLFYAIKLIESDEKAIEKYPELYNQVKGVFDKSKAYEYEFIVADYRYKFITEHISSIVKADKNSMLLSKSDKIDKVLTHKYIGIPIFLLIILSVFHIVFSEDFLYLNALFGVEFKNEGFINFMTAFGYEGEPVAGLLSPGVFLQGWMGFVTGSIITFFEGILPIGVWYTDLIVNGLLAGIDAVVSFIPQIMLLYVFLAILEDSGYMARVAFIMDRAFRKIGLSGKAFIPLLMGFGCSVPAMMATKTLEDERERNLTIRLAPFFSCVAKSPIWAMLAVVVAGSMKGDVFVFSIYLIGIVVAVFSALLIKAFSKNYSNAPFIMELPNYHLPQARNVLAMLWDKIKHFLYKVTTIITASVIVIWFLSNFDWDFYNGMVHIEDSMLASIGHGLKYIFYPLGFTAGDDGWKYAVATLTGLIAKEDVVATMEVLGIFAEDIKLSLPAIYAFGAFNLLTVPCMAAVATAKSESSKGEFIKTLIWWVASSYILAFVVFVIVSVFVLNILLGLLITVALFAIIILGLMYKLKSNKKV